VAEFLQSRQQHRGIRRPSCSGLRQRLARRHATGLFHHASFAIPGLAVRLTGGAVAIGVRRGLQSIDVLPFAALLWAGMLMMLAPTSLNGLDQGEGHGLGRQRVVRCRRSPRHIGSAAGSSQGSRQVKAWAANVEWGINSASIRSPLAVHPSPACRPAHTAW
jgi:hypothetical protein